MKGIDVTIATLTVRISASDEADLHDAVVEFAHGLVAPEQITAIRLGDGFADLDVARHPVSPKWLH